MKSFLLEVDERIKKKNRDLDESDVNLRRRQLPQAARLGRGEMSTFSVSNEETQNANVVVSPFCRFRRQHNITQFDCRWWFVSNFWRAKMTRLFFRFESRRRQPRHSAYPLVVVALLLSLVDVSLFFFSLRPFQVVNWQQWQSPHNETVSTHTHAQILFAVFCLTTSPTDCHVSLVHIGRLNETPDSICIHSRLFFLFGFAFFSFFLRKIRMIWLLKWDTF